MVEDVRPRDGARLPTGVVTFLFTDIEGSTRLVDRLGARYGPVLQQHRELLIDAFETGVTVDGEGDGLFIAFASASDAIHAAIRGQRFDRANPPRTPRWGRKLGCEVRAGTEHFPVF